MASRRYKVKKSAQTAQKDVAKDFIESSEVLAEQLSKTEDFIQKNKNLVLGVLAAVLLVVGGYLGYRYYIQGQNEIAQKDMFQAIFYFEQDSLDKALNGDGLNFGMLQIIEDYGATKAGNIARFYAGVSYLKKGEFQTAIEYLDDFSSSDLIVQARAYSLIGDAYMELGNYSDAASNYEKAASHKSNKEFTPQYLFKAALAYEKQSNYQAAIDNYQQVIDEYFGSAQYQDARKHKARLEALASP
ncbi:MAG: tetratricopeptide repeat protein [Cyclobacteriaceae bacterium]|nr:tetratricopeptide repeat protein [Cyclobacteriaceae bacterium]